MNYLSIPHYRGLKEKYSESLHGDGLYFTTDTHEIIANNASHGDNIASWNLHDGVLTLTMKSGAQQIVNFTEASETEKGLLSAADKSKLNAIEAGAQVNTVTGVKGNSESSYRTGNINITPTNIGLGNVDNTSDLDKPVSTAQQTALDKKVDKVTGYGLSKNDFTDILKNKLDGIAEGAQVNSITGVKGSSEETYRTGNVSISASNIGLGNVNNTSDADKPISTATQTALSNKVDKVSGKGLSTNDYTTSEKDKLAGIASGATKVIIDSALSSTSINPVQNKIIKAALDEINTKLSWKIID